MPGLIAENEGARLLGATLRNHRMARGMSLRVLARRLQLSGHGTLIDYEYGRRIPSEDLVLAWERIFRVPDGHLQKLREKALAERARQHTITLLTRRRDAASETRLSSPMATTTDPDLITMGSGRSRTGHRPPILVPVLAIFVVVAILTWPRTAWARLMSYRAIRGSE